ncbi:SRPBCC family protein [Aldersonia sp. NBC_00410]|uniref:SRPBCC family protein n=1 Tax=Aldersonia sp. NBC_00410 TaxID=2975954 RepID=UPI00225A0041|nr:SRPBCC family protein [Aldersonia sp. NBC_00410]MCX5045811.1 SRPBCC family protein [Aldersonia sp. NBC_00410]
MNANGEYVQVDGRPAVRFERHYPHPPERVWAAIIDPDQSRHWFPSKLLVEGRVGGTVDFSDDPNQADGVGKVLAFDPPYRLEFSWGADELRFELAAEGTGCVLRLTNVLEARDTAARNASGWTVCLAELDKWLADTPGDGPHSADASAAFEPTYQGYIAAGMPHGAPIPGRD